MTVNVDPRQLDLMVEHAMGIVGPAWIGRRLRRDQNRREQARSADHRRRLVRYSPDHLLVQWLKEHEAWKRTLQNLRSLPPPQSVVLLGDFANILNKTHTLPGFEGVISRIRQPSEFLAALFEAEVASAYVNMGWSVEFIEPSGNRSPDLKVITNTGQQFWVECKRREEMSERDQSVAAWWQELQRLLYRLWGPNRVNVALILEAARDPVQSDLESLVPLLLDHVDKLLLRTDRHAVEVTGQDPDNVFHFQIRFIADPDVLLPPPAVRLPNGFSFELSGEMKVDNLGQPTIRNPKLFAFKCGDITDRYAGAINSFRTAANQIPADGPGVIWIRIPYPPRYKQGAAEVDRLAVELQRELSGQQNTRVNAVVLSARFFEDDGTPAQAASVYRHVSKVICHSNPKAALQTT